MGGDFDSELEDWLRQLGVYKHLAGVPQVRDNHYSNYPIEITPLGRKFAVDICEMN